MYKREEIFPLYASINFSDRLDMAYSLIKKIHSLSDRIADLGRMAEMNI